MENIVRRRTRAVASSRQEVGTITVVTIGFVIVLGLLAVVVVNASAVFLEHRKLTNLADSIALGAADVLDVGYYQQHGDPGSLVIDEDLARSEANARVDPQTTVTLNVNNDEVLVRLERPVELWLVPGQRSSSLVVAEARAQLTALTP